MYATNVWLDLSSDDHVIGDGVRGDRLDRPPGATLAASVWELEPGVSSGDYHFHHGSEEMMLVLRGQPTLRSPAGERELAEGESVHFARGPEGAHQIINRSDAPVRYVMLAAHGSPEIIEYPDAGTLSVMARTESQQGEPLFAFYRLDSAFVRDE
jgi:uncharacterized cupin superfamily protein